MFPRVALAIVTIALSAASAGAACPPGQSRNCLDLDTVPQISQRIIAREPLPPAQKSAPRTETPQGYTGPTVGLSRTVRQVPTVGYHWATD